MAPTDVHQSPSLQDDQKFALMKFRRAVDDILKPQHDDYFLLRWLNARNWNPEAAEKMLRENMKWRERMAVDDVEKFQMPRAQKEFSPHGISGYDKGGSPIIIVPIAGLDLYGQLHAASRSDYIRGTIQNLERYMRIAYEQSEKHGPHARQFVMLFDMKDFNLRQYTWRPAGEVIISLIKTYEANYPEILKVCYMINVPKVFHFVYNIIKKFLNENTINKIVMFKTGSQKWLPKMLEHCDASQLPAHFGGTATDPDGNPMCLTKINYGGKVPEEYYTINTGADGNDGGNPNARRPEEFVETTIKKGGQLQMDFECTAENRVLRWEFRTFDHDIRFGVRYVNGRTGEEAVEVELARVASHQLDEIGFIDCHPGCTYSVVFDNSYSYFTAKRIRYAVDMVDHVMGAEGGSDEVEKGEDCVAV